VVVLDEGRGSDCPFLDTLSVFNQFDAFPINSYTIYNLTPLFQARSGTEIAPVSHTSFLLNGYIEINS